MTDRSRAYQTGERRIAQNQFTGGGFGFRQAFGKLYPNENVFKFREQRGAGVECEPPGARGQQCLARRSLP